MLSILKRFLGFAIAALTASNAFAADVATKAPSYQYPTTRCGIYYGANVLGSTTAVQNAQAGTQIVQGGIGLTLGWTCPMGAGFWFVDGDFDFANLNGGNANGFNLSGPAMLTQRFGFGAPVDMLMSLIPGLSALQNAMPSMIPLPTGISVSTSAPYLFGAFHQDDIGNQNGLQPFKQFVLSGGIGIGNKVRLSNGVVFDPSVEYILPSSKVCVGPVGLGCIHTGSGLRVVSKLEF